MFLKVNKVKIKYDKGGFVSPFINMTVNKGDFILLSGPSGCGKSTFAKALVGLLPLFVQMEGTISYRNLNLLDIETNQNLIKKGNIRYMPQETGLVFNPYMKAINQLIDVVKLYHLDLVNERVQQLLESVQLPLQSISNKYAHQLSGGEQQRLLLALTLASSPDLLIIDEPTSALNYELKIQVIELIKTMQLLKNITIICITHEVDLYINQATRHYNFQDDKFVELPQVIKPDRVLQSYASSNIKNIHNHILACKNIHVSFKVNNDEIEVLNDVSIILNQNTITGVAGVSGSGKSTLAKVLSKQLEPQKGTIYFNNEDVTKVDRKQLKLFSRSVHFLMQDAFAALNPSQTIEKILMAPLLYHKVYSNKQYAYKEILKWLQHLNLPLEILKFFPHQLSGGQQQRVLFLRAFAFKPQVLIIDECFTAIDEKNKTIVIEALKVFTKENDTACLLISHDVALLSQLCNTRYDLINGQLKPV